MGLLGDALLGRAIDGALSLVGTTGFSFNTFRMFINGRQVQGCIAAGEQSDQEVEPELGLYPYAHGYALGAKRMTLRLTMRKSTVEQFTQGIYRLTDVAPFEITYELTQRYSVIPIAFGHRLKYPACKFVGESVEVRRGDTEVLVECNVIVMGRATKENINGGTLAGLPGGAIR